MDKVKVAQALLHIAKDLMAGGLFSKVSRYYDRVTPEQLAALQKIARKYRGSVKKKGVGFGDIAVAVTFRDNFPESFATRDAEAFDAAVKGLKLERFNGMPELVGLTSSEQSREAAAGEVIPAAGLSQASRDFRDGLVTLAKNDIQELERSWNRTLKGKRVRYTMQPKADVLDGPISDVKLELREDFYFDIYFNGKKLRASLESCEFYD
jgi:hypothetical protein